MIKGDELLYKKIQRYIDGLLEGGTLKVGDRLLSEREIGRMFNASLIPVRRAMQPLIDEGVLEKVQGRGTFVRRTSRPTAKTGRIGVLHCHSSEGLFGSPFYLGIMTGIERELQAADRMLLLGSFAESTDPVRVVDELVSGVDGILFLDMLPSVRAKLDARLGRLTKPAVVVNYEDDIAGLDAVVTDSAGNSVRLVNRLIEAGHRRIMCLYGASEGEMHPNIAKRIEGYRSALATAGLPVDESLIVEAVTAEPATIAAAFTGPQPATAVYCTGSHMLERYLLSVLGTNGLRVPADVSIVTYDDLPVCAALAPGFTALDQKLDELGATAARRLIEKCSGDWMPGTGGCRMVLQAGIVDRGSVKTVL